MDMNIILGYLGALFVGVTLGLIGSGGSILSLPLFVYLFGLNPIIASAYSLFTVGLTSLVGSIKNIKLKLIDTYTVLYFSFSAAISVYITRKYLIDLIPDEIASFGNLIITKEKFLTTWIIDKEVVDNEYTKRFDQVNSELFPRKRRVHQYEHLGRYAFQLKQKIDLGFVGIHDKSKIVKFLHDNLKKKNNNYELPTSHPLGYVNFPLFGITKEEMFEHAKKHNFDKILKLTWSCWFPKVDGTPCGKCPMCRERVIDHPKLITV